MPHGIVSECSALATDANASPQLFCPFDPVVSPYAREAHLATLDWLEQTGLVTHPELLQKMVGAQFGWLAARTHPDASRDMLQIISDWYAWMFFHDDICDEAAIGTRPDHLDRYNHRLVELLEGAAPDSADGSIARALHGLGVRLRSVTTASIWWRRFVRSCRAYLDATVWEAANRVQHRVPDIATYVRMRPMTAGIVIDTEFISVTEGTHLPLEVYQHPTIRRIIESSNNVVCWANDILSLDKELRQGDVHNLVIVLHCERNMSMEDALRAAIEMHNDEVRAFCALEQCMTGFTTGVQASLLRFVAILQARMRGNLDWSRQTGRYTASPLVLQHPLAVTA